MKSVVLQSVAHINNLESIMECNAVEFCNRETKAAGSDAHYITELESKIQSLLILQLFPL